MNQKLIGKVKWFNNSKGYGFIADRGEDVFVHHSNVIMSGYRTLKANQEVAFIRTKGENGLFATEVEPIIYEMSAQFEKG